MTTKQLMNHSEILTDHVIIEQKVKNQIKTISN